MVASKKDTEARQWNIRKASKAFTIPPFSPNDPSSNPWSENPFILPETRFPRPARCKFSYFPLRMQFSKSMSPSAIFTCAILSNLSIRFPKQVSLKNEKQARKYEAKNKKWTEPQEPTQSIENFTLEIQESKRSLEIWRYGFQCYEDVLRPRIGSWKLSLK